MRTGWRRGGVPPVLAVEGLPCSASAGAARHRWRGRIGRGGGAASAAAAGRARAAGGEGGRRRWRSGGGGGGEAGGGGGGGRWPPRQPWRERRWGLG